MKNTKKSTIKGQLMDTYTEKIRSIAASLLKEGKVDKVIGYKKGSIPMATNPFAARTAEQVQELVFNSTCVMNLSNYITDENETIAVVAKGCDSRNIVTHIVENKIKRDQVYIIGVPCSGMVDKRRIAAEFGDDLTEFSEDGDKITVKSLEKEEVLKKQEYLRDCCTTCIQPNPVIHDELAGELVPEPEVENRFASVEKIENMDSEEKYQYFTELTADCIRCYACRNACPLCYCPTCFVDESGPQWVGKGQNETDIQTFHFLRAFHCAGRCTDCGACEDACPMGIKVREFTKKLNKDASELFGWDAGLDQTRRPPLDTYSPEDPDDFIK